LPMTVDAAEGRCAKTGAKHRPGPIERLLLLGPTGRSRPIGAAVGFLSERPVYPGT